MKMTGTDRLGILKPLIDAHTLGITSVKQLLGDCAYQCVMADAETCRALDALGDERQVAVIEHWIRHARITLIGFSYRLDPRDGAAIFEMLVQRLKARGLLTDQGGPIRGFYFAGLPEACALARRDVPETSGVFAGDESPSDIVRILGIDASVLPTTLARGLAYDDDRLAFGRDLIQKGAYLGVRPIDRNGYAEFGTTRDTLIDRLRHSVTHRLPPLLRAHVGPYLPDRAEAVKLFLGWTRELAASGFLDILSIGTSQLSQSNFGEEWGERPNGGGVPLNSPEEFAAVWQAGRPMLIRTYAGTRDIPALARMYEETIHIAWHALSFWWFCQIDGRGPHSVRENLGQHLDTLRYIARTGKPFEANVAHHFAFRGADDVTYIVAAVLAARTAKACGIRHFVLQNMLNTPKFTWGVQDLAKSRALLRLVRELEDDGFRVIFQPRAGLDYFAPDCDKAKAQLAAVTALMDDIEPQNPASPPVIHVVSYSEASHLADPSVVNESIQITRHALAEYRQLRVQGQIDDMAAHPEVVARTEELLAEARIVLHAIEAAIPNPETAAGLYRILALGFLTAPYLWACQDEFSAALRWQTRPLNGAVKVVDETGKPISASERMRQIGLNALTGTGGL